MQCPVQDKENAELLLAYCARTLEPDTLAALERHIAACPECSAFAGQQRALWKALDSWQPEPISSDFDSRLYRRIAQLDARPWWQRIAPANWQATWRPALSLATVCITLLAVFMLRAPRLYDSQAHAPRTEMVDVEQVELTLEDMEMLRQLNVVVANSETEESKPL
jgi:anti-sigma factor RsiW